MRKDQPLLSLAGWLALTLAMAALGSIGSLSAPTFYAQLSKPPWAPPAAVFGPVWTVLYVLMAIAAWLVWRRRGADGRVRWALIVFVAQLALNALWSWLFFKWRLGEAAVIEVAVLWVLVAATLVLFWRVRRAAGLLLAPYLVWVTFATALTASIWQRNPALL